MNNVGKHITRYLSTWGKFDWATANCCHFAAGWVHLCEGVNPMPTDLGITTQMSAHRIIASLGGPEAAITHFFSRPPLKMSELKDGYIVMVTLPVGFSLGIVSGRHGAFCTEQGVQLLEISAPCVGWAVNT